MLRIPDFRTPGTGLYAKVAEYGLPKPEAIFSLDYFMSNPETFYSVAGSLMMYNAKPVNAHFFIKKIADEGNLLKCFTQNIDGLELDAGLDKELLVQAHGHMRTSRCCVCRTESPIEKYHEHIDKKTVLFCSEEGCRGVVKPDVTFFGEGLPDEFRDNCMLLKQSDLVIVMGTSLKVQPFSLLLSLVPETTPILLLNHDNVIQGRRSNVLYIPGDIEDNICNLCAELGWSLKRDSGVVGAGDSDSSSVVGGGGGGSCCIVGEADEEDA